MKEKEGLRLRSLKEFNRVVFAKQCWRIISNEISLVATFFKARYFRNTIFLEVELVFYPSHVWRSLPFVGERS